ncbi:MAG: sensor histidine kinase [Deltaproteobacteria bacterium]
MLLTRTIRRKFLLGVGLVLVMLLILSASGISGLNSYRNVIGQLNSDINEAPQKAELVAAAAALFDPMGEHVVGDGADEWRIRDDTSVLAQQQRIAELIETAQKRLAEFRDRAERLPRTSFHEGQRMVRDLLLNNYDSGLQELARVNKQLGRQPEDRQRRIETLRKMVDQTVGLVTAAEKIPEPVAGINDSLEHAKDVYLSSVVAVWAASAVVLVLFLGLLRSGYVWIFDPLRKLHQGARRVAQGDFNYRVTLKTRDEMAELADAFNKMTSRFQEIAADLDRQVQERSRQLVRSERLAGVGFLAAGVAHEINNPLSAIAMASESLEGRVLGILGGLDSAEAGVIRQYLRMIQDESFRCKQITERLLDFSRGRDATRESTDIARLVSEVVAMVQYLSRYREKRIEFSNGGPCCADVNGPEIKQVILNLVANGLDAVERGGTLRIRLQEQTDHLVLEFTDDGCGMTPEVIENLFEPFFTRKQSGQGTGLGLSISHRIIHLHGGSISGTSPGPGLGSTFAVRLPRKAQTQSAAA